MPYKDINKRRDCNKKCMRKKRGTQQDNMVSVPHFNNWKENIKETNTEFLDRTILPKHIYLYRPILKEMLKIKFGKRVFKKMDKTELITNSYSIF